MSSYLWINCRIAFCVIFVWIIISSVVDCPSFKSFCHRIIIIQSLTCQYRVFILSLCFGCAWCLTKIICSCVLGIKSYVMFIRFLFYNESKSCISNLLIGKWCTVKIISICYGSVQFHILFISWVCHARLFICHVKINEEILTTFKYVKIYR